MNDLCFTSALELSTSLRERKLSARETVSAFIEQIERVNPQVNAICTFLPELALEQADRLDQQPAPRGLLHGLPIAIKDLALTKGIRTTFGSPIYQDFVPTTDDLFVSRLREAGAVIVGKTNTPEFGAGSQTFNTVFGPTRNPYDLSRTCGGSSGGAAAALASGMLPLADGSDLGGSLRNPASFCNVVGFRPSPGRVPVWPADLGWNTLGIVGPMARTVTDLALLLAVMAGPDQRAPISIDQAGTLFLDDLAREFSGVRIAWSRDFGGFPFEPEVQDVCERALSVFSNLHCTVEAGSPDVSDADEIFGVLRAAMFAAKLGEDYQQHRARLKDTVIWNYEQGIKLSAVDVMRAESKRTALYHRVSQFLTDYEYLVLPTVQVAPFSIEQEWVHEINGTRMNSYIDWMASCYAITLTGFPAISVPAGFTATGLPIGLQIVGRHQQDFAVLQLAYAFEQATKHHLTRPKVVQE